MVQALSIGEERVIGEKLLYSVRSQFDILDDPDIHQYINSLGQDVIATAGPQYFDYHFFVINSSTFNAFAAPAGLVFFYTGLIESMKNEDELLSVMAHEIGHVVSRHIAQRVEKVGKVTATSFALGLAGLALGIPSLSQGIMMGSLAAGQSAQLAYSRHDEEQADRRAFESLQQMRRNPKAMEDMLLTMRRISRYRSGKLPQYLLTHPNPEARIGYVQSLLDTDKHQQEKGYYTSVDNFAFFRFKYRLMQYSGNPEKLRIYCLNQQKASRSKEQQIMAHFGLSLLAKEERKYERALQHLQEVQKAYPDKYILDIDKAIIYAENSQYKKAIEILDALIKRYPIDTYALYERAQIAYKVKDYDTAEKLYLEVAKWMPQYSQLFFELGHLYADKGEQPLSRFYVGKYNLYKGRIKTAKRCMEETVKDGRVSKDIMQQAQKILDDLKRLKQKK